MVSILADNMKQRNKLIAPSPKPFIIKEYKERKPVMKTLFTVFIMVLLCMGCDSTPEKEEKMDLEEVRDHKTGLDYKDKQDDISETFDVLSEKIDQWFQAHEQGQVAFAEALDSDLEYFVKGHFTVITNELAKGDSPYQAISAAALGFTSDLRAIPYLMDALASTNPKVQNNAAMSIGRVASDQTPLQPLLDAFDSSSDNDVRSMLMFAISRVVRAEVDTEALPYLQKGASDSSPEVRNYSLIALRILDLKKEDSEDTFLSALKDEDDTVKYNAIAALGDLDSKRAIRPMIAILKDSENPELRSAAHFALRQITGEDIEDDPSKWEEWVGDYYVE